MAGPNPLPLSTPATGYPVAEETFDALEIEWLELLSQAIVNTPFSLPLWKKLWWQAFGGGRELLLLSVREGGKLVGVAPLLREGGRAQFLGDTRTADYSDFVVARGHEGLFYHSLLDYLEAKNIASLYLESVPSTSPTLTELLGQAKLRGYTVSADVEDVCPRIELPATWDDYLSFLSKKDRHELRRKIRRLLDRRQVRWYGLECSQIRDNDLDDFFRLFRLSRDEKARFLDAEMEKFFREMAAAMVSASHLRLFFMELEGTRMATSLCFDYRGELLLYNSGFDPAYGPLSVGLLLKAFCIKEAIEAGRKAFDFLRGSEAYKYDLGGQDRAIHRCIIERG
ncbi:MAG: GNAT family N-acetyltransferase [Chloroflexi bacterium]|nr:GNAT family N-acetyltransferase [Chloroflexota bacterium]